MLRTLLESRARREQYSFGTAASAAIHIVLITTAAYGTVTHARPQEDDGPPVILRWARPASALPSHPAQPQRRSSATSNVRVVKGPAISIDIPSHIPDVSIPLGAVRNDDFAPAGSLASGIQSSPDALGSGEKSGPYDSYQVDVPVTSLGGAAPAYPPAMRAAGIEGEVKAEFVVDSKGRADAGSLRIISSTNDRFSDAIRDALPKMRFTAARLRGEPVAQLVQQLFVFRLNR